MTKIIDKKRLSKIDIDWKEQDIRKEYTRETGKYPMYADFPTEDYMKFLEKKEMEEGIQAVLLEEERLNELNESH